MISLAGKFVHPTKGFELDAYTLARHLGRVVRFGGAIDHVLHRPAAQHRWSPTWRGRSSWAGRKYRRVDPFQCRALRTAA